VARSTSRKRATFPPPERGFITSTTASPRNRSLVSGIAITSTSGRPADGPPAKVADDGADSDIGRVVHPQVHPGIGDGRGSHPKRDPNTGGCLSHRGGERERGRRMAEGNDEETGRRTRRESGAGRPADLVGRFRPTSGFRIRLVTVEVSAIASTP
jgi:hypothetical protein